MEFTYDSYGDLIALLRENGYQIADYHDYKKYENPCILRHDVDCSLEKALQFAQVEAKLGVKATYFVLVSSNFYNVFSKSSTAILKKLMALGHEIGLHFDETVYSVGGGWNLALIDLVIYEKGLLQSVCKKDISVVSMHIPSKELLEGDVQIPGMINSYSKEFFKSFKYVSDSEKRWREDVCSVVQSRAHQKLHILTHAIWYDQKELSLQGSIQSFLSERKDKSWDWIHESVIPLKNILCRGEIG